MNSKPTKPKSRLQEIREIRLEKVKTLRDMGINPYPASSEKNFPNNEVVENYEKYEGKKVTLTGRLMSWREHGNIAFGHIQDESGQIQLFIQKKLLSETSKEHQTLGFKDAMKLVDVGDFVQATGEVGKTVRGEVSLMPTELKLLSKSIRPLPDAWSGFKDIEERYRQRYVDLIINEDVREVFKVRSKVVTLLRKYLDERGFTEVKTPSLQPLYGGATAKPFVTHHNALDFDMYLRIADELYLKRLIVGGFSKVYEIGTDFRNEGIDRWHNPEFQMLEFYWSYADYNDLMELSEEMLSEIVKEITNSHQIKYGEFDVDFTTPWRRLTYRDAILEKTDIDIDEVVSLDELKQRIQSNKLNVDLGDAKDLPTGFDNLYKVLVRPYLIDPVFLIDHPESMRPLAKKKYSDQKKVESIQLVIAGAEIFNAYTELNDPVDQKERWLVDMERGEGGADEYQVLDDDYIRALEYGMPPTAGWGMGIDRFTALLTNQHTIKDVILFPTLKPLSSNITTQNAKKKVNTGKVEGTISDELLEKFPGTSYAYTVISGVSIEKKDKELEQLKKEALASRKDLTLDEIKEIQPIKVYREMLKETGVNVNSRRPSPEALLRRIVQGKGLYTVNTAVDAYNMAVVETGIGLGGFNLAEVEMPVELRFAKEGETMHLLGDDEPTETKEGEIVYSDSEKPLTLDLNYRDIGQTKITLDTTDIILFADGGPGINIDDVVKALELGAKYIQKFCGGKISETKVVK